VDSSGSDTANIRYRTDAGRGKDGAGGCLLAE
jgi:hypothetical protein